MRHYAAQLTLPVPAVIVVTLSSPSVAVDPVRPAPIVIVNADGYLKITIPDPPAPPPMRAVFPPEPPSPPSPRFAVPLAPLISRSLAPPRPPVAKVIEVPVIRLADPAPADPLPASPDEELPLPPAPPAPPPPPPPLEIGPEPPAFP